MRFDKLEGFMKKHFGTRSVDVLKKHLSRCGIDNLNYASSSDRKILATSIRNDLEVKSFSKKNLLYSELLNLLNVKIDSKQKLNIEQDSKFDKYAQETKLKNFVKELDQSFLKFETIFNLFWLRAGEAESRGMKHEDVIKITQKALNGIRNNLNEKQKEIMKEYDIHYNDNHNFNNFFLGKSNLDFNFKKEDEKKDKIKIKKAVEEFWNNLNDYYNEFKNIFMESLNDEIELKKENKDDTALIEKTQTRMLKTWSQIQNNYDEFINNMKKIRDEINEDE